ncbi:hypothetical protein E2C01_039119 [Portunus trituberculatus]|uniref:Uncharacterized protein n=1 Tax=Portunus trituberculatus TaxID=210409 RepID=A0A5B7FDY5_PORTR|nr:hypothetical protein [Portunus trituberculatus]
MYPDFLPFSSSAGDYTTNQNNNNLLVRSCLPAHCEVNYHPETRGDVLPWSEITVPLVTCHLPPATRVFELQSLEGEDMLCLKFTHIKLSPPDNCPTSRSPLKNVSDVFMKTDEDEEFPHLAGATGSAGKRVLLPSPSRPGPGKVPRTAITDCQPSQDPYMKASFLLRSTTGARIFSNPSKVSHVLHNSSFVKYILEGETHALGNSAFLIIAVWEHNIPKVPELEKPSFHLGD